MKNGLANYHARLVLSCLVDLTSMVIYKCDRCKRVLKEREHTVGVRVRFEGWELCSTCARPVTNFLRTSKLVTAETLAKLNS